MDDSGDIDVERILEEVRERVRRRERAARATFDGTAPIEERQAVSDLAVLHGAANLHGVPLPTDRKLVGGIVVRVKRTLLRLLFPVLQRQVEYNEANARLVWYLKEHVDRLVRELDRARAARLPSDEGRDGR
jgi:hypothetical protein